MKKTIMEERVCVGTLEKYRQKYVEEQRKRRSDDFYEDLERVRRTLFNEIISTPANFHRARLVKGKEDEKLKLHVRISVNATGARDLVQIGDPKDHWPIVATKKDESGNLVPVRGFSKKHTGTKDKRFFRMLVDYYKPFGCFVKTNVRRRDSWTFLDVDLFYTRSDR